MISEKLSRAIQLIKSGNRQAALPILKEIIRATPEDENAWLWLYACVDKVEEKKYCLQKALEINPGNEQARYALGKLTDPTLEIFEQATPRKATHLGVPSKNKPDAARNNRPRLFAVGAILLLLVCIAVPFLYLLQTGQLASLAANLPLLASATSTATPSITLAPTVTATPSPSPVFTSTATRRPSATFIPELFIATLPPSPVPFVPGNPTATPLGNDITNPDFIEGVAAYGARQFETVVTLMSNVIEANPELAPPYRHRGMAYWYLGDCLSGLPDLDKALAIDPTYASAWAGRGVLKQCLGRDQDAIGDLQKALSLDGSLAVARHNLGIAYFKMRVYQKSFEEYSLAVAIDPNRAAAWSGRSEALAHLRRYDECIESASQAIEVNAEEWLAYSNRADCHYALKDYETAIADYKIGLSSQGRDAHIYCQLSYSYFEIKEYENVLDAGKSSIKINPACGGQKLLEVMARSAYALGDYDQALDYIDQAFTWNSSYSIGHYYRGIILQAAGKNEEAIQALTDFIATAYSGPETEDAKARLAELEP